MSDKVVILAKGGKGGDVPCSWKMCDKKHKFKIKYPNKGVVDRSTLKEWSHPFIYSKDTPKFQKDLLSMDDILKSITYAYQRHHVIPCGVYSKVKRLSHNLKLINYDINNEMDNGISLPADPKDMVWHDLQYHRGYHSSYNKIVLADMKELQSNILKFCANDDQGELLKEVEKKVKKYKTKILNWSIPLYGNSFVLRRKHFKKIGIVIPKP